MENSDLSDNSSIQELCSDSEEDLQFGKIGPDFGTAFSDNEKELPEEEAPV